MSDFLAQFRKYAANVRRDRRLKGVNVRSITLESQLESKDSVTLDAIIEKGVVKDFGYRIRACSLAQATTGIIAAHSLGLTAETLQAAQKSLELILLNQAPEKSSLIWPELLVLQNAVGMPSRHEVALLPFHALQKLLTLEEEQIPSYK